MILVQPVQKEAVRRRQRARQDISRLLTELKAQGVASASFHPDGLLASVSFGTPDTEPDSTGADPEARAEHFKRERDALSVLRGIREPDGTPFGDEEPS